ncbi:hypothetical protein [Microbacterium hominis]|uniref:hypothetical protein n=1 Tax=Microbacterium hominis TaxID=162426 RepID=UPI0021E00953|nr:hypothetical protein [Microbacterium hominis]
MSARPWARSPRAIQLSRVAEVARQRGAQGVLRRGHLDERVDLAARVERLQDAADGRRRGLVAGEKETARRSGVPVDADP